MQTAPLRSGTDRSDPGFNLSVIDDRARIAAHVGRDGAARLLPGDAGMIVRARYSAFEGEIANGPHLRIGLNVGAPARLVQEVGASRLEGLWRPGTLAITPPDRSGATACGRVDMIGLAIVPGALGWSRVPDADRLDMLARTFAADALLASVLTALHHEAEAHGASTAFFDHGVALILQRLADLNDTSPPHRPAHPLSRSRLDRLAAYVDGRLVANLSVVDMAAVAGMDPSGFTRALRARTGLAPYAWLTERRMARARRLLESGLPVTQVAAQVGYANAGKFATAFRRLTGTTPSQWGRDRLERADAALVRGFDIRAGRT